MVEELQSAPSRLVSRKVELAELNRCVSTLLEKKQAFTRSEYPETGRLESCESAFPELFTTQSSPISPADRDRSFRKPFDLVRHLKSSREHPDPLGARCPDHQRFSL